MMVMPEHITMKTYANEKGYTLFELLAVIVILGILATIAVPLVGKLIDDQRKNAYVGNAYAIKDAGNLYLQEKIVSNDTVTEVSYKELVSGGYLEEIKDPDTRNVWDITTNPSYITVFNHQVVAVYLQGDKRTLCDKDKGPISFEDIKKESVVEIK